MQNTKAHIQNRFGKTQNEIFTNIFDRYFKNRMSEIDEYGFLAILNMTYRNFRTVRSTKVDHERVPNVGLFYGSGEAIKSAIGIFPLCDAELDEKGKLLPRFLKKFSNPSLDIKNLKIYYRISNSNASTASSHTISTVQMFRQLSWIGQSRMIFKVLLRLCCRRFFWRFNFPEKISILKAIISFEINYQYFSSTGVGDTSDLETLYITNFYSPENLGVIKAFLEMNIDVVDIQHGVQKNVAAYEHKEIIPISIKPTGFLHWFDIDQAKYKKTGINHFKFDGIEKRLKYGRGLNILISLQPSNSHMFFEELNLIDLSRHSIHIRPHPRRKSKESFKIFEKFLDFEFSLDLNSDINTIMTKVDLHLTEYSSCVLDGVNQGVPSICFHPIARDYFSDLICNRMVRTYDSVGNFLRND